MNVQEAIDVVSEHLDRKRKANGGTFVVRQPSFDEALEVLVDTAWMYKELSK